MCEIWYKIAVDLKREGILYSNLHAEIQIITFIHGVETEDVKGDVKLFKVAGGLKIQHTDKCC